MIVKIVGQLKRKMCLLIEIYTTTYNVFLHQCKPEADKAFRSDDYFLGI